ncbi:hypothetical protein N9R48_03395, partial [Rickettsiales bacterium]|nr:hypothetical protein [Rickettsiales bacterium]
VTSINLMDNNIGDQGAEALAQVLEKNSTVTSINLSGNNIGDEGTEALALALKEKSTVTSINLSGNNIGAEGAKALAQVLEKNSTVTSINLSGNNIGAEGAKALAQVLEENSTVTSIDLSFNNIGPEGAKALADALQVNKTLIELNLQRNQIGAKGAVALAQALKENSTVTSIDLSYNNIGPEGAKALAQVLEKNSTVTSIYLVGNNIGVEGAEALALALEKNTTVTHLTLNLNGNGIGKEISDKINQLIERNKKIATIKASLLKGAEIVRIKEGQISIGGTKYDKKVAKLAIKSIVNDLEPDANDNYSKKSRKESITNKLKDKNKSNHLYFLARILNSLNAHGEKIFSDNEINILIEEFVESDELIKSINAISRTISSSKQILQEYKQDKENTGCSSSSSSKFLSLSPEARSCIFYQMLPPKTKDIFTKKVNHRYSASIKGSEMQEGDDQINIKKLESFIEIFTPEINKEMDIKYIINHKMDINYIINHYTQYDFKPDPASTIHSASNEASLKGRNVGR